MNQIYIVKVINRASQETVKESSVTGISKASKLLDGISINLNKDLYFVTMTIKN